MKQRKLSAGARFGLYVLSLLLGIVLFVSTFATGVLFSIRSVITEDNIRSAVQQSDIADSLAEPISEIIYENLEIVKEDGDVISREEMEEIVEESEIVDFIADKAALLVTDFMEGESNTILKKKEIIKLLDKNADVIEEIVGQRLTEEEQEEIADAFFENEMVKVVAKDGLQGVMDLMEEAPEELFPMEDLKPSELNVLTTTMSTVSTVITTIRDFSTAKSLTLCCAVCLVLVVLIILVNILQLPVGFRRASYPIILVGTAAIPLLLVQAPIPLWDKIPGFGYVQSMVSPFTTVYGAILGIGLVLLIAGIVLAIIKRSLKKVEAAPVAPVQTAPAVNAVPTVTAAPAVTAAPVEPVTIVEPTVPEEPVASEEPVAPEEPVASAEPVAVTEPTI